MCAFSENGSHFVISMPEWLRESESLGNTVSMADEWSGTSVIARSCAREDREFRQARKGATVPIISLCRGGA